MLKRVQHDGVNVASFGIIGSKGRMGQALGIAIGEAGHSLAGGVDAGELAGPLALQADVLIDFSAPQALDANLKAARVEGIPILIGTTGLEQAHFAAIDEAAKAGLRVPLVYNSSGYDKAATLGLLEGIFDIYMPDFKFWDPKVAQQLCDAPDYPEVARGAVREMHRQVGDLVLDGQGIAQRGVLIRHLVLPDGLAGTREVMRFLAEEISPNSYVNVMAQYRPCGHASNVPSLSKGISDQEYGDAIDLAQKEGITRLDERKRAFVLRWF